jgi:hypothetical protein
MNDYGKLGYFLKSRGKDCDSAPEMTSPKDIEHYYTKIFVSPTHVISLKNWGGGCAQPKKNCYLMFDPKGKYLGYIGEHNKKLVAGYVPDIIELEGFNLEEISEFRQFTEFLASEYPENYDATDSQDYGDRKYYYEKIFKSPTEYIDLNDWKGSYVQVKGFYFMFTDEGKYIGYSTEEGESFVPQNFPLKEFHFENPDENCSVKPESFDIVRNFDLEEEIKEKLLLLRGTDDITDYLGYNIQVWTKKGFRE